MKAPTQTEAVSLLYLDLPCRGDAVQDSSEEAIYASCISPIQRSPQLSKLPPSASKALVKGVLGAARIAATRSVAAAQQKSSLAAPTSMQSARIQISKAITANPQRSPLASQFQGDATVADCARTMHLDSSFVSEVIAIIAEVCSEDGAFGEAIEQAVGSEGVPGKSVGGFPPFEV